MIRYEIPPDMIDLVLRVLKIENIYRAFLSPPELSRLGDLVVDLEHARTVNAEEAAKAEGEQLSLADSYYAGMELGHRIAKALNKKKR